MSNPNTLIWFPFTAEGRAVHLPGAAITHAHQTVPKLRSDAAIVWVTERFTQFSIFDQLGVFAAKLEFVSLIVNRPRAIGFHVNAAIDTANEIIKRLIARFKIEICHAIDGRTIPRGRPRTGNTRNATSCLALKTA